MSFDGYFAHAITQELNDHLREGRVSRIYQPFEQEIHFQIRANRQNHRLKISTHPVYYHINLTEERPTNPTEPPMFLMVLRKYLLNARIQDIRQYQNDRIIDLHFTTRNEIGDVHPYRLTVELMGRLSNLLLVDEQTEEIVDLIKPVPPYQNSYRTLLPGAEYIRPPHNEQQTNLWELSDLELMRWAEEHADSLREGKAHQVVQGLSRQTGQLLKHWMIEKSLSAYECLVRFHQHIQHPLPTIITGDQRMYFYAMDLEQVTGTRNTFPHLSQLLDTFFEESLQHDRVQQMTGNLSRHLKQLIKRHRNRLKNLAKDRLIAQDAELYKLYGELLSAYSYQITKGDTSVELPNYYEDHALIEIPLKPEKSPIENSQYYFHQYRRFRDSLSHIDQQEANAQSEIDYLETILLLLEQSDLGNVEEIQEELIKGGYIRRQRRHNRDTNKKSSPRVFESRDGTRILVGRNNRQNDQLSLRQASKDHYWLHARNIPGSHVIVQSNHPSEETLVEAAELAAYFSRYRDSSNVPVDIVQVQHLRKPKGAKPGFVIYEGQRTIYVTPDPRDFQEVKQV